MIRRVFLVLALLTCVAAPARAQAPEERPVVVELFTSQGCTSCPQANRILGSLAREPGVIALTFGVGYWDYLGWSDTFARPEYSNRQRNYARALRLRAPYTPQFVIGGAHQLSASRIEEARGVAEQMRAEGPPPGAPRLAIEREGSNVRVQVGAGETGEAADVWLVEFDPGPLTVEIMGGENSGRRVIHHNVVRRVTRIGVWSGAADTLEHGRCSPQCAALVQSPNGGPILAAASTRR